LTFIKKFGIDKSKLYNIKINGISFKKLEANLGACTLQTMGEVMAVLNLDTGNYKEIAYLKIVDEIMFNCLIVGVKKTKGKSIAYVNLDLHIDSIRGDNLEPLNMEEYYILIANVKEYIFDKYGIDLDFTEAKFKELELNVTMLLDRDFTEYEHILKLMTLLAPKRYKAKMLGMDNRNNITTIVLDNKSIDCKVYDKTKQLKVVYKILIDDNCIRIEYTLKTIAKISKDLGGNIHSLTDKDIKEYLQNRVYEDLIKPTEKHIEEGNKILKKMVKEEQKKAPKKWTRLFLLKSITESIDNKIPLVFDIEQVKAIIKEKTKTNYARTIDRLEEELSSYKYLNNNFTKLNEIKEKIFEKEA
jgi:hypothetical protein